MAREASDIVLLDDNFASIVGAVEEGRAIFENIRKFLTYILTSNVPELVPYLAFAFARVPLALTVIQILAVDLGTDIVPALGLGVEKPESAVMCRPPRTRTDRLLTSGLLARAYLGLGLLEAIAAMAAFGFVPVSAGWSWGTTLVPDDPIYRQATTACLTAIVLMQVLNMHLCRTRRAPISSRRFFGNRVITAGIVTELVLILLIDHTNAGNAIFGTAPLGWPAWAVVLPFALAMLLLKELRKRIVRGREAPIAAAHNGLAAESGLLRFLLAALATPDRPKPPNPTPRLYFGPMHRVLPKKMAGAAAAVTATIALGLLAAAPSAQSQAQPPPRSNGVVIGRVVDGATAATVQGAIVTLTGPGIRPRRVLVDARGRFVFAELPAGTFTITSTRTGYLAGACGTLRPDGSGRPLELADGERVLDAVVRMWRYSTISGTVTDDAGDAVPYVRVQALRRTVVAGRWQMVNSNIGANSDDSGTYRITGLVPGDYALVITSMVSSLPASLLSVADLMRRTPGPESSAKMAELSTNGTGGFANDLMQGFGTQRFGDLLLQSTSAKVSPDGRTLETYPTVWYPSAATPSQAASVTLGPGDARTGIDLHPTLMRTHTVSGTVIGPDGPVPHMAMRIVPAGLENTTAEITSSLSNSLTTAMTASDVNGAFTFVAVPPGQYIIRAGTSPRPPPEPSPTPGATPLPPLVTKDPIWWTATPVSVGQEDTKGVSVALRQGVRITGRVEFAGAAPRPTPAELRAVRLSMDPADGRSVAYSSAYQAQIEADGHFYTIGLMAGRYLLRLDSPPRGWTVQSAIVNGRDIYDVPIAIDSDPIDGLVVTFTDRPSIVIGTVRKAEGRPDDDATVLIFPATGQWTDLGTNPRRLRSARASRSGTFRVSGLPPGEYFIVAVSDAVAGNWQEPAFLQKLARIATRFTLTPGQNLTQTLSTAEGVVR